MKICGPHTAVSLHEPYTIDETVLLAYPAARDIASSTLTIWADATIRSGTVIYCGSTIGAGLQTGHNVVVREENLIGNGCKFWNNTVIDYGCRIGNSVKIHANCYIAQYTTIEDNVFIAPGVSIANDIHPGCPEAAECMRGPHLETGVQVGVNATILPLVHIGRHSLIAAGAVVTRDIPPYSLVAGNPGRVIKDVRELKCKTGKRANPYPFT